MGLPSFVRYGLSRNGSSFGSATIYDVWMKAAIVPGYDPNNWRKDACGAWMAFNDYGNTSSQYGWEIDHIQPVSRGGTDDLWNLQPLQWQNNRGKGDNYPNWACSVRAT